MTLDRRAPLVSLLFVMTLTAASAAARSRIAAPLPNPDPSIAVSREIAMTGEVGYAPVSFGNASDARVAVAPDQSLVVWRTSEALRLSAEGQRIDPLPLTLPLTARDVMWDGEHYLVAGSSWRSGGSTVDLLALSKDGRIDWIQHLQPTLAIDEMRLARRGDDVALVWSSYNPNGSENVKALVLDKSGNVLAKYDVEQSAIVPSLTVTAGSDGYLLLSDRGAIFDAATLRSVHLPLASAVGADAAWNGSSYFVAGTTTTGIIGFTVDSSGASSSPTLIHTSEFTTYRPRVEYDGTAYRLLWKQARNASTPNGPVTIDFFTTSVSVAGLVAPPVQLIARSDEQNRYGRSLDGADLEFRDGRAVLTWTEMNGSPPLAYRWAYAATFDIGVNITAESLASRKVLLTQGAVAPSPLTLVAHPGAFQSFLKTATNFVNFSVGRSEGTSQIDPLPSTMQDRSTGAQLAAWNGVNTTVVWHANDHSAWAGEIDLRGHLFSSFPIPVSRRFDHFNEFVCGPNDCLLKYTTVDENTYESPRYYIQRLAPTGAPLDAPVEPPGMQPSSPTSQDAGYFSIAPLGSGYLIVMRWGGQAANMTVASFFSGGHLSDVVPLIDGTAGAVAFVLSGGPDCLVGIGDRLGGRTTLVRVDKKLNVLARTPVALPPVTLQVWDGRNWIFAWTDTASIRPVAIRAARIRHDLSDLDVVTLLATNGGERLSGLTSVGDGSFVMLYSRPDYSAPYGGATRSYLRWVDDFK